MDYFSIKKMMYLEQVQLDTLGAETIGFLDLKRKSVHKKDRYLIIVIQGKNSYIRGDNNTNFNLYNISAESCYFSEEVGITIFIRNRKMQY